MKSRLEIYLKIYDSCNAFIIGLHKKKSAEVLETSKGRIRFMTYIQIS